MTRPYDSIYSHGFVRVAIGIPHVRVSDTDFNTERTIGLARRAAEERAALVLFPELGLSAYTNDDLFQQDALLEGVLEGLGRIVQASESLAPVIIVGAPLRISQRLYNCGVVILGGRILGVVPKSYLPDYREFYESRQFASGRAADVEEVTILGQTVPFGPGLLFAATNVPDFIFAPEICEDLWVPVPPSTIAALAGATIIPNLSASNITVGKADYRHKLCGAHSGRCVAAYLYSGAGAGESTTDLAWDGHALIYENSDLLAESERFSDEEQLITTDIDLERLIQDRSRLTTFRDAAAEYRESTRNVRRIPFSIDIPSGPVPLRRDISRFPYVPSGARDLDERCFEAYNIQVHGLAQRLRSTKIEKLVLGVSGGLDSTQALLVAVRAFDRLGLPRTNILGYTMPGFATSEKTRGNAHYLMEALGISAEEIDIRPSATQMLKDIRHPYAEGHPVHDVTFENVQAGERTSHLFRLANHHAAMVLGTGDLSELALGWATYGVGDHMSHYNVNASVPKTLIQHLIRWVIDTEALPEASEVLRSILETEISPELVPASEETGEIQSTQSRIGPYELQDFNLYYITRFGFRPSKVAFLAEAAWGDRDRGAWPPLFPQEKRNEYDRATIRSWLEVFLYRFFEISQFKRSAVPNSPKVGSGGSLSPRGDWRAPSDSVATAWLDELRRNVPI